MNQVKERKLPLLIMIAIVLFLPFLGKGGLLASAIIAAALVGSPLFVLIGIATLGSLFLWSDFREPQQFTIVIEGIRSLADSPTLLAIPFFIMSGANGIANHPHIPAGQIELIAAGLGKEMAAFKQMDTAVHDLSLEIKAAAESHARASVVSGYLKTIEGCVACHNVYKDRVSAALGNTAWSPASGGLPALEKEIAVKAPLEDVWRAWTTVEGLRFISRDSRIELRAGGPYEWFLDGEPDDYHQRGSQGSHVLAFIPCEMIAFSWTFPPDVPELRYADERTQVVVMFREDDDGMVHVQLRALGWKDGNDWRRGWAYFDQAWGAVLAALHQHFE